MYITRNRPAVVVLTPRVPFPQRSGFDLRVMANVQALARSRRVGVFGLYSDTSDRESAPSDLVVRMSCRFTPDVMARLGQTSLEWLRDADGHPSDRWYTDRVLSEVSSFVAEIGAKLVVVESLWLHRYIRPLRALGCRVVLDAHGLESALHDELAAGTPGPLAHRFAERTSLVEAAAFGAADQVWIPSAREAKLAVQRLGGHLAPVVVPNVIEVERYGPIAPRGDDFVVIYPAAFGAPQNANAASRLVSGIFPALRRRVPNARLVLMGRNPTREMLATAHDDPRIEVTGLVADANAYLRAADVMAVPLIEGHGTRFKVLEAFASRLPVLSTRKGIEGIDAQAGEHYLAAESDQDFVEQLARLASEPRLADALVRNALELVRAQYSLGRISEIVSSALDTEPVT